MKYLSISQSTTIWQISKDDYESDKYNEKLDLYIEAQKKLASEYGMEFQHTESFIIEKMKYSINRCLSCGNWTMDRNGNPVKDLEYKDIKDGATVNNTLLCYECLPSGHRWSWS